MMGTLQYQYALYLDFLPAAQYEGKSVSGIFVNVNYRFFHKGKEVYIPNLLALTAHFNPGFRPVLNNLICLSWAPPKGISFKINQFQYNEAISHLRDVDRIEVYVPREGCFIKTFDGSQYRLSLHECKKYLLELAEKTPDTTPVESVYVGTYTTGD